MMSYKNTDEAKKSRKRGREVDEEPTEQRERRLGKRREGEKECHSGEHSNAMRLRQQRRKALETPEERETRLEKQRIRDKQRRAFESEEHRQTRLEKQRIRNAQSRAVESEELAQANMLRKTENCQCTE